MRTEKFKSSEVGPIPEEWEVKSIANVAPLQRGFDLPSSQLRKGLIPVVYSNGIGAYHNQGKCYAPGLITGRSGTIGRFTYISSGEYWPHNTSLWVTDFYGNCPLFIKYLYETLDFEDFSTGTGVPTLNRNSVHEHKIAVPPRPEQERIAEALSDVDALLSAMTTLIEKKRAIKQGAMQQLLGMRNDELGMRNEPVRRLAGFIGPWVKKRLGDCGTAIRGVNYKPCQAYLCNGLGRTMLLRSNNIQENVLNLEDVVYVSDGCIGDEQRMRHGDVLICAANGSRNLVGKAAWLQKNLNVTFGAFMAVFRSNQTVTSELIAFLLQSDSYRRQLDDILSGSAINNLNVKDILGLSFAVPPTLAEQQAIAAVLIDMDAEIAALETKRAKYESVKQGMMQELLTGKTRLEGV